MIRDKDGEKNEGVLAGTRRATAGPSDGKLISVIIVVFNGERHLERAVASVVEQDYEHRELIIIDGGSTDGTPGIIKKYQDAVAYWVSEPDNGIYDAMNKGLDAATGDWIYFLGSDDVLYDRHTLGVVSAFLDPKMSLAFGDIMYHNRGIVKSRFNPFTLLHNTIHHQGAFYNARLFRDWRYDAGIRLIADYELNLRIYLERMKYRHIDAVIAICDEGGQSREDLERAFSETNMVRNKYLHGFIGRMLSLLYSIKFRINRG